MTRMSVQGLGPAQRLIWLALGWALFAGIPLILLANIGSWSWFYLAVYLVVLSGLLIASGVVQFREKKLLAEDFSDLEDQDDPR